jgi:membrane protein YqaA with SNARE-associated domain
LLKTKKAIAFVGAAVGAVAGGLTGYIIGEKKKQQ